MARLLFAHAHPDDESLWTGVTMAHHVARGDEVHVLTWDQLNAYDVLRSDAVVFSKSALDAFIASKTAKEITA